MTGSADKIGILLLDLLKVSVLGLLTFITCNYAREHAYL